MSVEFAAPDDAGPAFPQSHPTGARGLDRVIAAGWALAAGLLAVACTLTSYTIHLLTAIPDFDKITYRDDVITYSGWGTPRLFGPGQAVSAGSLPPGPAYALVWLAAALVLAAAATALARGLHRRLALAAGWLTAAGLLGSTISAALELVARSQTRTLTAHIQVVPGPGAWLVTSAVVVTALTGLASLRSPRQWATTLRGNPGTATDRS